MSILDEIKQQDTAEENSRMLRELMSQQAELTEQISTLTAAVNDLIEQQTNTATSIARLAGKRSNRPQSSPPSGDSQAQPSEPSTPSGPPPKTRVLRKRTVAELDGPTPRNMAPYTPDPPAPLPPPQY